MPFPKNTYDIKKNKLLLNSIWAPLKAAYNDANSITVTYRHNAEALVKSNTLKRRLLTLKKADDTGYKDGFISDVSVSDNVATCTVKLFKGDTLAEGDKYFKIAYQKLIDDFAVEAFISGELSADAINPQGRTKKLASAAYGLISHINLQVAASGSGAKCEIMPYRNDTSLMTTAIDLGTDESIEAVMFTNGTTLGSIDAGDLYSVRIPDVGGADNLPAGLEIESVMIPQFIYESGHFEF